MDSKIDIEPCKMILSLIVNGFFVEDKEVPGLSSIYNLSDIDYKMLYIASAMFCSSNTVVITADGDIDIQDIQDIQLGGAETDITKFKAQDFSPAVISIKPKKSKLMLFRFIYILTFILNLAVTLRVMFYLYQNTFQEKINIMSNSGERLNTLIKNYPSESLTLDYQHVLKLMNEYGSLTETTQDISTDLAITKFAENIAQLTENKGRLQLGMPQITDDDLKIETDKLISPVRGILNIYRYSMKNIFEYREIKLEEYLYNNEIYLNLQDNYESTNKIINDMKTQIEQFKDKIAKDATELTQQANKPALESLTVSLTGFVSGFFTEKPSSIDVARAKSALLTEIVTVWSRIMVQGPIESSNIMNAITMFFANISTTTGLIQEQVYIASTIYSFFQFILFLIYTKMIEKKITVKEYNQIAEQIQKDVEESVSEYFGKHNLSENQDLKQLTEIFIDKFFIKISDPNSGDFESSKSDIKSYVSKTIDEIIANHSRNDVLQNMRVILSGSNNAFSLEELANINKLLSKIYKENDTVGLEDVGLQFEERKVEQIEGGSNHVQKGTKRTRRRRKSNKKRQTKKHNGN